MKYWFFLFGVLTFCSCTPSLPEDVEAVYASLPAKIDFNSDVKPILSDKCFACHGPDKGSLKAGLRLDIAEAAYAEMPETPGKKAIVPGSLAKSEVFHRIISTDPSYLMPEPESHLTLSAYEKAVLIKWMKDGAEYKPHWAFIKPEKPTVPTVKQKEAIINPIDNFVVQKLEQKKWSLSPAADKEILLRRLSLDLTGLPPTLEELDTFLNDASQDAYEKQVTRLMASPHFGEKMAVDWLDVARFADSHGYTVDRIRDMSPWRDWVINSFNNNLPYSDFITWQLAGDLLPNPTREQLIATAFNRNHQQNGEGGIVEEEFKVEYVSDRANTTAEAFMAMTASCAKCHDHKYDPISQKEYFQLYSFFNNVKEAGQISWDDAMPVPTLVLTNSEQDRIIASLKGEAAQKETALASSKQLEDSSFEKWLQSGMYKKIGTQKYPGDLAAHYPLKGDVRNTINREEATLARESNGGEKPVFGKTEKGTSLLLDGDVWLNMKNTAKYNRTEPFSIGVWVTIPRELTNGVIFHRCNSTLLYNYRGFCLNVKDDKLELKMAHTAPYNAIIEFTKDDVIKEEWIQLTLTYDGSSKASGLKVYMNGKEMETTIDQDNLYKDIILWGNPQSLQLGAWSRGKGLTGGKATDVMVFDRELTPIEIQQLYQPATFANLAGKSIPQLSADEKALLQQYYFANISAESKKIKAELQKIRSSLNDTTERIPELMVMEETPEPIPAYLLDRGDYTSPAERVYPDVPQSILPMPDSLPRNRLGLAKWLLHPDHPLTTRVAVNRYWQLLFGKGLVRTAEDFGNQGEMPSHPELLDWLAISFRESGWDVKALVKQMVMSATYRQSSLASPDIMEADPENVLLARASPSRLTAEMVRDNALFASGLLNKNIGGKSAYPYQPEDLWRMNGSRYMQDSGSLVYRRGMYTIWRRSIPNPTQATFDVGIRTSCIVRRQKTNTPLQALITLNDPTYVEAAKVMGEEMTRVGNTKNAITAAFRKLTGRKPTEQELDVLIELFTKEAKKFEQQPAKTKGWLNTGQYEVDAALPVHLVAANAVIASTIINTDASITKR